MTATATRGLTPIRTVLDGGAVVLTQEASVTPAVAINATFQAGSIYEPADLTGLAHLTGRVLDRGTKRRSADVIAEELDDRGVALRVTTTRHLLSLSCTCLSEHFDEVLSIILDIARGAVFPDEELAKRRNETITAVKQDEDNPAVRAMESFFELVYGEQHPYAQRAKGTVTSVERIQRFHLVEFHARRICPATLSLAIVGDVRHQHALTRAALEINGWNAAATERAAVPPPAVPPERRTRVITIPGKSQTDIAYGFAAVRRLDPRYYAYWITNNILGQFGLGGRLADNIRERQGIAYYIFSSFEPAFGKGPLLVRAGVDPNNVARAIDAIDFEVGRLGADGPTDEELAETRNYLIGSIPRLLETNQAVAAFLQTAEQFGLGVDYDQQLPRLLQAVTIEEVRAAAAEVLRPEVAAVAIAGPAAHVS